MSTTVTPAGYSRGFLAAIERARTVTAGTVPVAARRAEIIDLALQGLTVPQMRALYVAHYSGAPLPGGLARAGVAEALRTAALAALDEPDVAAIERDTLMAVQAVGNAVNNSTWAEARGHAGGHLAYPQDATPGPQPGTAVMSVRIAGVWYDLTLHPAG